METRITDGRVNLHGNFVVREKPKYADCIPYINANNSVTVVEAKEWSNILMYVLIVGR